jgi:hypothetical protein
MAGFILFLVSMFWFGCNTEDGDKGSGVASLLPPGDVIEVRDGDYSAGPPPVAVGAADAGTADAGAAGVAALPRIVALSGPPSVTNGGTAVLHVTLAPPVDAPRFVVWHEGDDGYHTVVGVDPEHDGTYDIGIQVAALANQTSLVLNVALLDAAGNAGPAQQVEIALITSGTGDVKVTLSFDRLHDLDLHVTEPSGAEIYYQQPLSDSGGRIDLDSGAHCQPSASNSENIFWPPGGAPAGTYQVSVQNYQQCSPGDIAFTVTVEHDGSVEVFDGSFADGTAAEMPSASNLRQITTFEHKR